MVINSKLEKTVLDHALADAVAKNERRLSVIQARGRRLPFDQKEEKTIMKTNGILRNWLQWIRESEVGACTGWEIRYYPNHVMKEGTNVE